MNGAWLNAVTLNYEKIPDYQSGHFPPRKHYLILLMEYQRIFSVILNAQLAGKQ